jgi:hypothetical protein
MVPVPWPIQSSPVSTISTAMMVRTILISFSFETKICQYGYPTLAQYMKRMIAERGERISEQNFSRPRL